MNMDEGRTKRQTSSGTLNLPKHIKYKIRQDIDDTPETESFREMWVVLYNFCWPKTLHKCTFVNFKENFTTNFR